MRFSLANALLNAASMAPLQERDTAEASLIRKLSAQVNSLPARQLHQGFDGGQDYGGLFAGHVVAAVGHAEPHTIGRKGHEIGGKLLRLRWARTWAALAAISMPSAVAAGSPPALVK